MNFDIRAEWAKRRWWMNLIFLFCLFMTFIYLPYDLFTKPVADDEEVWFGFVLHGWWAKSTGLLHWLVYGAGAYGFWKMAHWMWPWAAVYTAQVALSMLVWNLMDERGEGWTAGIAAAALFMIPTIALWRARSAFRAAGDAGSDDRAPQRPGDGVHVRFVRSRSFCGLRGVPRSRRSGRR